MTTAQDVDYNAIHMAIWRFIVYIKSRYNRKLGAKNDC